MQDAQARTPPEPLPGPQDPGEAIDTDATVLPEVEVTDERELQRPVEIELPPDRPVTVINAAAIERRQASTIFDILKDIPGVAVDGGPRASGMKFNLRGFSDNEDVLFKVDGAVKGFEKYRFGSGVFIEPELLKALQVERGPSVTAGSGALGGTVSATTKSASDFLKPGQTFGSEVKYGYNWNSHERLRMVTLYGRPNAHLDLIVSVARRDSDDFRLPDGERLVLLITGHRREGDPPLHSLNPVTAGCFRQSQHPRSTKVGCSFRCPLASAVRASAPPSRWRSRWRCRAVPT